MIKRTRTTRSKKTPATKRAGVKAPLQFPKRRATPSSSAQDSAAAASGPLRPPKPLSHHKHAPWADMPPTEKVRKFADEIFGSFELSLHKRK